MKNLARGILPQHIHDAVNGLIGMYGLNLDDLLCQAKNESDVPGKWLTMQEAMAYAKVSRWTIRRWADDGKIKVVKLADSRSGKLLIFSSTLTAWLDSLVISSQTSEAVTRNG